MSLRWQIALALALIAGFVGSAAATGAYVATAKRLDSSVDESLVSLVRSLTDGSRGPIRGDGDHGPSRGPDAGGSTVGGCPDAGTLQPATTAQLVSSSGTVTQCLAGAPELPTTAADPAPAAGSRTLRTVSVAGRSYRVVVAAWPGGGAIQIGRDLDESHQVLASLRDRLVFITLIGVALASLGGWLLARRIARPIVGLRNAAEQIADTQDLSTDIPAAGTGEVGSLATSFTAMVQALRSSRDQQQRLVDDASHEMRTPLTSLTSNLEHLHHVDQLPPAERTEMLRAVQADVGELTNLLTELVELATDRTGDDEAVELVELAALAREQADRFARRTGRSMTVTSEPPVVSVPVRPHMVERAISNLIDNATKYSPEGSPVELTVMGGRLEVRDHGPGIAEKDQPLVFDRFYRALEARTEPGSGLGLAIVRQIVERHDGRVWAGRHADGGAVVGFELPVAP